MPPSHAALADDVPGVADFASDLDDDEDDDDDDDDDDEEGRDEDAASADDGDSGRETKPPHASKAGKSNIRPKAAPKLPPKKGVTSALPLHAPTCSTSSPFIHHAMVAGGRTRVEIEYETETSSTANATYNQ
jgi:hypothetical protein